MLVSLVHAEADLGISSLTDWFSDLVVVKTMSLFNFFLSCWSALIVKINRNLGSWRLSSCRTQCRWRPVTIANSIENGNSINILASHTVQSVIKSLSVERDVVTAGCRLRNVSFVMFNLIVGCFVERCRILICEVGNTWIGCDSSDLLQQVSFSCQAGYAGFSVDSCAGSSCSVKFGVRLGGFNYSLMSALVIILVGDCRGKIVDIRSILGKEAVKRLRSSGELSWTFSWQNSLMCLSLHYSAYPSQRSSRTVRDKFLSG